MNYYNKYQKYKIKYINLKNYNSFLPDKLQSVYRSFRYSISNEFSSHPFSNRTLQFGGGSKLHKWKYKNKTYTFDINTLNYKDTIEISIVSKSGKDCILASISKIDNTALIQKQIGREHF